MKDFKVCIDPGHGGKDPGAVAHDLEEEDFNLIIASLASMQLINAGYEVIQTRTDDSSTSLERRTRLANETCCDLFVSIHANAAEDTRAEGVEVYHYSDTGKVASEVVIKHISASFPALNSRGIKKGWFYVLRKTEMPAILIECGFVTNEDEAFFLKDESNQVLMAEAISRGIIAYAS